MNYDRMPEIIKKYGEEYMYLQLAEECAELGQAALKMARVYRKATPVTKEEAMMRVIEEIADVRVMTDAIYAHMMDESQRRCVYDTMDSKEKRMYSRMLDGKEG